MPEIKSHNPTERSWKMFTYSTVWNSGLAQCSPYWLVFKNSIILDIFPPLRPKPLFTPDSFHGPLFDRFETHSKDFILTQSSPATISSTGAARWSMETQHHYCSVCTDGTMKRSFWLCASDSIKLWWEHNTSHNRAIMTTKDICRNPQQPAVVYTGWTAWARAILRIVHRGAAPRCHAGRGQISPSQLSGCIGSAGAPDTGTPCPPPKAPSDLLLQF